MNHSIESLSTGGASYAAKEDSTRPCRPEWRNPFVCCQLGL